MKQRRKSLDAKITIIGGKYFRCHVVNKPVMLNYDYIRQDYLRDLKYRKGPEKNLMGFYIHRLSFMF